MNKALAKNWINLFQKMDHLEVDLCYSINNYGENQYIRSFFRYISRLGDGFFWYIAIIALPIIYGLDGLISLIDIACGGVISIAIYWYLKNRLVRERPYISFRSVIPHIMPLDRYSFPSGHTMNAVNFSLMIGYFHPILLFIVIPFTFLVAISRVVLGMHYPSDVVIGALLGSMVAYCVILLQPSYSVINSIKTIGIYLI